MSADPPVIAWLEPYSTMERLMEQVGTLDLKRLASFRPLYNPVRLGNQQRYGLLQRDRAKALREITNVISHSDEADDKTEHTEGEVDAAAGQDVAQDHLAQEDVEEDLQDPEANEPAEEEEADDLKTFYKKGAWWLSSASSSSSSSASSSSKSSSSTKELPPLPLFEEDKRDKFADVFLYKHLVLGGTTASSVLNHWRVVLKYYNKFVVLEGIPFKGYIKPVFTIETKKPVGTAYTLEESAHHAGFREMPIIKRIKTSPDNLLTLARDNPINNRLYLPLLADCQVWAEYVGAGLVQWQV